MRFQVPQFIETETKIIGPFTLRQFFWIAGGGVILFLLNIILPFTYFIILAIPVTGLSLAFAFYKVSGQPLINYVLDAIAFSLSSKKYFFGKSEPSNIYIPSQSEKNPPKF